MAFSARQDASRRQMREREAERQGRLTSGPVDVGLFVAHDLVELFSIFLLFASELGERVAKNIATLVKNLKEVTTFFLFHLINGTEN
jgi:hypothetical protein